MKIPKKFHSLLWDTDILQLNWEQDKYYLTVRFLEYGDTLALKWLKNNYPLIEFLPEFLNTSYARNLSNHTINYWKVLLNIRKLPWETEEYLTNRKKFWID